VCPLARVSPTIPELALGNGCATTSSGSNNVPQSVPVERAPLGHRERVMAHQVQQYVGPRAPTGVNQVGVPCDDDHKDERHGGDAGQDGPGALSTQPVHDDPSGEQHRGPQRRCNCPRPVERQQRHPDRGQ